MAKTTPDDLEAVRAVVAALESFDAKDQERILRWVREKLGLPLSSATGPPASAVSRVDEIREPDVSGGAVPRPPDIKTFVINKNPQSDSQFAATVAYYYRFEAPEPQRKPAITKDDLQEACRQAGRPRLRYPAQTLVNAQNQGYLDRAGERGAYCVNTVGENLVAMALPESTSKPVSHKRANKRKGTRTGGKAPKGAARGNKRTK